MGVLTDLVVARADDAQRLGEDINSEEFDWDEVPGLSIVKLTSLFRILKKDGRSPKLPLVCDESAQDLWVYSIDAELVERLANLQDSELLATAQLWIDNEEEFSIEGWPQQEVRKLLKTLKQLCLKAKRKKLSLFLRQSL